MVKATTFMHTHARGAMPAACILFLGMLALWHPGQGFAKAKDAASHPDAYFLTVEEVVDSRSLLPPPPEPGSPAFQFDEAMYQHGMQLRSTEAGKIAAEDATSTNAEIIASFSEAFGCTIGKDTTPAIFALAFKVMGDAGSLATRSAKAGYSRIRPYAYHEAATCNPKGQLLVHPRHSYPSGHSAAGWALALVLSEINPLRQEAILHRGLEMGQGRVVCGYHWQSDVDAGRVLASAVVARLHANGRFVRELAAAKEEWSLKSGTESNDGKKPE